MSNKANQKRQKQAIVKIQTAVRKFLCILRYKRIIDKRNSSATCLQQAWKRYRMLSLFPKAIKQIKNIRLGIIQKYIRGYLAYNKVQKELVKMKLKQLEFFDKIKQKLYEDSQIKIRYYWRLRKR